MLQSKMFGGIMWVALSLLVVVGIVIYFETVPEYARQHSRLFIHVSAEEARREHPPVHDDFNDLWMRSPRR